jgi:uncharacterized protein (TIGR02186 family)
MRLRLFLAFFLFPALSFAQSGDTGAGAPLTLNSPLIADVSQNTIELRSDFNGARLLIFGARNVPGDLVIALRGEPVRASLRQKERIAGMWMHVGERDYAPLPVFYALASTKPLNRLAPPTTLQALGLGEARIIQAASPEVDDVFDQALAAKFRAKRWWQSPFGGITYFGESLFKARITLPDTLPKGNYTAEVYLFDRGQLVGYQMIPLRAYKIGVDATIESAANTHPLVYGLLAVLMALSGGWLGHRLFHRGERLRSKI